MHDEFLDLRNSLLDVDFGDIDFGRRAAALFCRFPAKPCHSLQTRSFRLSRALGLGVATCICVLSVKVSWSFSQSIPAVERSDSA